MEIQACFMLKAIISLYWQRNTILILSLLTEMNHKTIYLKWWRSQIFILFSCWCHSGNRLIWEPINKKRIYIYLEWCRCTSSNCSMVALTGYYPCMLGMIWWKLQDTAASLQFGIFVVKKYPFFIKIWNPTFWIYLLVPQSSQRNTTSVTKILLT